MLKLRLQSSLAFLLITINVIKAVHVVRYNAESSHFKWLHYNDLDLAFKDKYMLEEIPEVLNDGNCLSECNYVRVCRYGYFLNSVCYICNKTAEDYLIDWTKIEGKKQADGVLYKRIR